MKPAELLENGLNEIGMSCSGEQTAAFMYYLSELTKWNRTYSLTSLRTDNDIIIKHFIDSLLYLRAIPEGVMKLADIGAGAGFPGIPIKIIRPETDMALIEPSRKKASFLRHIIRLLKLKGIIVIEERLENLDKEHEDAYDVIVSRATFGIREFLKTACPYVRKNGILIISKGPRVSEELKELDADPSPSGSVREMHRLRLPFGGAERNLVVLACEGIFRTLGSWNP